MKSVYKLISEGFFLAKPLFIGLGFYTADQDAYLSLSQRV